MCYNCCNRESVNVCNDVSVVQKCGKFNVDGCVLTDKQLVDFQPLSAKSEPLGVIVSNLITDSECADHCYNFESDEGGEIPDEGGEIPDDCGDVNAIIDTGVTIEKKTKGVPNLNKFGKFDDSDRKKLGIDEINFNANGFAISLWFKPNNTEQDARFVAKAINNYVQGHIVSAQLIDGGFLRFRLKLGNDVNDGTVEFQTNNHVDANKWWHAVYWYDGCNVKIYINGEEQLLNETIPGMEPNNPRVFADFKGQKVFQGDQPVAIGSQPVDPIQDFRGFRAYNGDMDQVIIWNHPISQEVISELYSDGKGSTTIPIEVCSSYAGFGTVHNQYSHLLRTFTQELCVTTCFDQGLYCLFTGCESISVFITKDLEPESTLVYKAKNLSEWPGDVQILEKIENTQDDCIIYTIRLTLDIEKLFGCPIDIKGKNVTFTVDNPYSIKKPINPFTITGMKRKTQKKCC